MCYSLLVMNWLYFYNECLPIIDSKNILHFVVNFLSILQDRYFSTLVKMKEDVNLTFVLW